jgi:hypothetical protein
MDKKRKNFTQVSNIALKDKNLSLKAKGLYALMQSYITIDNFTIYKATLQKDCKEKDASFNATWQELKQKGYLKQHRFITSEGKFIYSYQLLEAPNHIVVFHIR